jgi:predicted Zn-dependent peptidase
MYQVEKLSNGVRIVLVPMESVSSTSVGVYVACGSRYETEDISGVSHFLEHMVFKGTKKYPSFDDVHVVERIGGIQNAYTSTDVTKYYAKVLANDWEKTLDVTSQLALEPLLPDREFDVERKVIFEEMAMYEDDLPSKSDEVFHNLMYGDNSLGRRIIGSQETLSRVTRDVMEKYMKEKYKSGDIVVVISGKIENTKEVIKAVKDRFEALPKAANGGFEIVTHSQDKSRVNVVTKPKAEQANLVVGFPTCDRFSEDKYALQVFNLLMGVGFTSRLFKKIREEKGLCYSIRSGLSTYHELGDWSIWAGLDTKRVDEALSSILDELKKVLMQGVSQEELRVAKKRHASGTAFQMESPDAVGEFYGKRVVYGLPMMTIDEYLEKIESVTLSDIERITKKYFLSDKLNLVVVGKFHKKDESRWLKLLSL